MGGIVSKYPFTSKRSQYREEVAESTPYDIESQPQPVISEEDYSYRNYYKGNDTFGRVICRTDGGANRIDRGYNLSSEWFEFTSDIKVDLMEKQQMENKKWEIKQLEKRLEESLKKWDSQNRQNHDDSIMFFSKYNNACLYQ